MNRIIMCSFLVLCSFTALSSELITDDNLSSDINICQIEDAKYGFRIDLADLILSRTEGYYGKAKLQPYRSENIVISQNRCLILLRQQKVDLLYLPPKKELLTHFEFIPFDMHAGMLGYRVFLIREEDRTRFSTIKTIEDLRTLTGGFGSQWGDFKIFGLNGLPVVGAANTTVLTNMLKLGRFDYFHRGLHEAWKELDVLSEQNKGIVVEEHVALRYPFPVYFWFNKENEELKQRFETGLLLVLQDGSYHALFHRYFSDIVKKASLEKRTIIDIEYPVSGDVGRHMDLVKHEPFWIN